MSVPNSQDNAGQHPQRLQANNFEQEDSREAGEGLVQNGVGDEDDGIEEDTVDGANIDSEDRVSLEASERVDDNENEEVRPDLTDMATSKRQYEILELLDEVREDAHSTRRVVEDNKTTLKGIDDKLQVQEDKIDGIEQHLAIQSTNMDSISGRMNTLLSRLNSIRVSQIPTQGNAPQPGTQTPASTPATASQPMKLELNMLFPSSLLRITAAGETPQDQTDPNEDDADAGHH